MIYCRNFEQNLLRSRLFVHAKTSPIKVHTGFETNTVVKSMTENASKQTVKNERLKMQINLNGQMK